MVKHYRYMSPCELNQALIEFYKGQFLKFLQIGINRETEYGVIVTNKLIKSTENRLDQLIKNKKTSSNTSDIEKGICKVTGKRLLYNSNRSFSGKITSKFQLKDLEPMQQHNVCNYIDYGYNYPYNEHQYIDKIMTAYNSETMRAVLSHDN